VFVDTCVEFFTHDLRSSDELFTFVPPQADPLGRRIADPRRAEHCFETGKIEAALAKSRDNLQTEVTHESIPAGGTPELLPAAVVNI